MGKTSTLKALVTLLLVMLLFLCVAIFSHTPTKTFAAHIDVTLTPTAIVSVTAEPSPSPTSQADPSPTPQPSPTMAPSPTPTATLAPTATPLPTATSIPTAVPSPTVGITPTVVVKPTIAVTPTVVAKPTVVHSTPVATQKAGVGPIPMPTVTQTPTVIPTQPTMAPVDITSKKTVSPAQSPLRKDSPMVPLVVGTLLTLCLGAGGVVGVRRVRTALLPAIDMKKQRNHTFAHSWQRVRTAPTAVPPLHHLQETIPFAPVPLRAESASSSPIMGIPPSTIMNEDVMADEGPKTGSHHHLGPVRLRKITKIEPVLPVEAQTLPTDIEDMSFLDDPLLQDTLRHYRQKGQKQD